jgi:hypothetical protein
VERSSELGALRRQLDRITSRRLQGQLDLATAALYRDLCDRERRLIATCCTAGASTG